MSRIEQLISEIEEYIDSCKFQALSNSKIIVNKEEMVDAKEHPEDHPELIVRVAGYSAYFTRLTPGIQDEVINRMDHDL